MLSCVMMFSLVQQMRPEHVVTAVCRGTRGHRLLGGMDVALWRRELMRHTAPALRRPQGAVSKS